MIQNQRLNPNSKHVCLLIPESHQNKKKKKRNKRKSEEAKRAKNQPKRGCLCMAHHCTAQTTLLSLPCLLGRGNAWSSCLTGYPCLSPLPGHGGDLPSSAVVVMAENFIGRGLV